MKQPRQPSRSNSCIRLPKFEAFRNKFTFGITGIELVFVIHVYSNAISFSIDGSVW